MHHAILGAGGVGGTMGACLAHVGEQVTMVVRPGAVEKFPAALRLESPLLGNFSAAVRKSAQVPSCDVLWLAVKATQLEDALQTVPDPNAAKAVVPLLNGIDHVARLRGLFGRERVIPATIAGEMERVTPGHYVHPSPFAMLNVAGSGRDLLADVLAKLETLGFSCRFVDDETTLMWNKLVFLGPFALATSAYDAPIGEVLANGTWHQKLETCIREFCSVALAEGAQVNPDKVVAAFSMVPKDMRSSMQKDVDRGNLPELEAIAGPVLRGGARHGISVAATGELAAAVEHRTQVSSQHR
ncbi:MAG: 2-dehydropantoate 2-reductase [Acidobacteria bacterium]|nr:MAG: 2-dehydropantoate 2-reductase [Acidobacteriota bacterium]